MTPEDIVLVGERMHRYLTAEQLRHVSIVVSGDDRNAMRDWMAQWEPVTQWPMPERAPARQMKVRDIPITRG